MILPVVFETDYSARAESPAPYSQRPPSLSALYNTSSPVHLASAPPGRHRNPQHSSASASASAHPLSARSSRSTLRTMGGSRASARDDGLPSSPTIENALLASHRRLSAASSSVLSDDLDNWPGFDSHPPEHLYPTSPETDTSDEHWPHERNSSSSGDDDNGDDDPYSSAALSRRAEIILANAKKRLNVGTVP